MNRRLKKLIEQKAWETLTDYGYNDSQLLEQLTQKVLGKLNEQILPDDFGGMGGSNTAGPYTIDGLIVTVFTYGGRVTIRIVDYSSNPPVVIYDGPATDSDGNPNLKTITKGSIAQWVRDFLNRKPVTTDTKRMEVDPTVTPVLKKPGFRPGGGIGPVDAGPLGN